MADIDQEDVPTIDPALWPPPPPLLANGDVDEAAVRQWIGRWVFGGRETDGDGSKGVRRDVH